MLSYDEYLKIKLVDVYTFQKDPELIPILDKYLHLTLEEFNTVNDFAIRYNMKFNKKDLNYAIDFNTGDDINFSVKYFELLRQIPNLGCAKYSASSTKRYSIFVQRDCEFSDHRNLENIFIYSYKKSNLISFKVRIDTTPDEHVTISQPFDDLKMKTYILQHKIYL